MDGVEQDRFSKPANPDSIAVSWQVRLMSSFTTWTDGLCT